MGSEEGAMCVMGMRGEFMYGRSRQGRAVVQRGYRVESFLLLFL